MGNLEQKITVDSIATNKTVTPITAKSLCNNPFPFVFCADIGVSQLFNVL